MLGFADKIRIFIGLCIPATIFPHSSAAGAYLSGIVTDAGTLRPIDSVRIASSLYSSIGYSDSEGSFSLPLSDRINCRPDTQTIDTGTEYFLMVSYQQTIHRLVTDSPVDGAPARLFDLRGRRMALKPPAVNSTSQFPDRAITPGLYLLSINGFHPQRILITNNRFKGTFTRSERILQQVRLPNCPSGDTVFFCRAGYWPAAMPVSAVRAVPAVSLRKKQWIAFDIHQHTVLTDGVATQDSLFHHAFAINGLDLCTNSEHGGIYYYDTLGGYIADDSLAYSQAPHDSNSWAIPRWYTLREYSWPKILGQRTIYPDKILLQGLEWNVPGHEHASVGFVNDADQPQAVSDFEYRFDCNDRDTSRPELVKRNNWYAHADALAGLRWLDSLYPRSSYFFINHPSREAIGPYYIDAFRDFNNLAPDICFAFEGMPGHHKASTRGKYYYGSGERNRTWGGADYILAQRGGLWDALLGEGRHFWIIVNSDFHDLYNDHWPGEYTKTRVAVADTGAQAWLDGMRRGEMFITLGDLVSELEFSVDDGIHVAGMGTDFHAYSDTLAVTIRFRSPARNGHGTTPLVEHIDLIAGPVSGRIDPEDAQYTYPSHPGTVVLDRFAKSDWNSEDEWHTIRTTVVCDHPTFFRLRGSNNPVNSDEIDANGDPLIDPSGNTEEIAWNDLWFYSNPVFVYPR
jgi:hypothetical protein